MHKMALNKFDGRSFHKKIVFGKSTKIRDENDGSEKMAFKSLTDPFFCAPVVHTMHQNYEAEGTKFQGTRQVAVNHQWVGSKITHEMKLAQIDQQIYLIVDNSPDESSNPTAVDILSLKLLESIDDG